jgi:hypothetical protein
VASKEDVQRLLWHYGNLHDNTDLLVEFCGQRKLSLVDGFRSVCEEIAILQKQLAEMKG